MGERLQAVVEQVLGLARQDDVQGREPPAARVAVALPEGDGAAGSLPDAVPGVALVVPDLFGEAGLDMVPLWSSKRRTSLVLQDEALGVFVAALDQAWAASTRKAVTALLARLRGTRDYAATFHKDPADPVFPQLEMLIPAVAQTARRWDRRVGRVSVLTDEQQMLTDDALRTVREYACAPVGMTLLTRERGADVAAVVRGDSVDHPSIQLADLLAGAAAAVTERHEGNPSDVGEGLWPVITSFVEQSSLLPYDDPAAQLRSVKERPVRR